MEQEENKQPETQKQIFREKSLERISSPEQLSDYIHVVSTGTWVLLCAIIALLIGAAVFCAVISFETRSVTAAVIVKNGEMTLYVTEEGKNDIREGMTFRIAEGEYTLPELELSAVKLFAETDSDIMRILSTDGSEYVYYEHLYIDLPNGIYTATIVSESVSPYSLLFN